MIGPLFPGFDLAFAARGLSSCSVEVENPPGIKRTAAGVAMPEVQPIIGYLLQTPPLTDRLLPKRTGMPGPNLLAPRRPVGAPVLHRPPHSTQVPPPLVLCS